MGSGVSAVANPISRVVEKKIGTNPLSAAKLPQKIVEGSSGLSLKKTFNSVKDKVKDVYDEASQDLGQEMKTTTGRTVTGATVGAIAGIPGGPAGMAAGAAIGGGAGYMQAKGKEAKEQAMAVASEANRIQQDMMEEQVKQVEVARTERAKELKSAEDQKVDMAQRDKAVQFRDSARERQRKLSLGSRGRRSTILTQGADSAATSGKKTLLGQ
jgi:hypothetical protein